MFEPIREFDLYGVFMPPLLVFATLSLFLVRFAHGVLARRGFYRTDLEQQLFDTSLFVIFTGLLSFLLR